MWGLRMPRKPDAADTPSIAGMPAPPWLTKNCSSCARRARSGRRIGTARQRRRPPSRLAVRLVEHRERRPVDDHRLIEAPDQILQFLHRHELPAVPAAPVPGSPSASTGRQNGGRCGITVERHEDRLRDDARRILQHDERLTLVLDPSGRERPELRSFQRRVLTASRRHRVGHRPPPRLIAIEGLRHDDAKSP